jgi:beta-phosphoglucomutase-like phosphatase (HAD superfamily)
LKKGFLFDCDGVLLDSMPVWNQIERDVAGIIGCTLDAEDIFKFYSAPSADLVQHFQQKYQFDINLEVLASLTRDTALSFYQHDVEAIAGALEVVQMLYSLGYPLAVASASPQAYLDAGLSRAGLDQYFSLIGSADAMGMHKSDPQFYRMICQSIGIDCNLSWGIDDSALALQAMRQAGLRTLGLYDPLNRSCTFADLQAIAEIAVRNYSELPNDWFV